MEIGDGVVGNGCGQKGTGRRMRCADINNAINADLSDTTQDKRCALMNKGRKSGRVMKCIHMKIQARGGERATAPVLIKCIHM